MRMEGKIRHWLRVKIWRHIKGCNKYGRWGHYEINLYPLRRRAVFIVYSGCNLIDGLIGLLTLGSYCPDLGTEFILNNKVSKWQDKETQ